MRSLGRYFDTQAWQEVTHRCSAVFVGRRGRLGMAIKSGARAWFSVSGDSGRPACHNAVPGVFAPVSIVGDTVHLSV